MLYVTCNEKLLLAGFFRGKLQTNQMTWIPCDIKALCIASAIKHFSPFIIQSKHKAVMLTDSKFWMQAYDQVCYAEFSAIACVSMFLTSVSRF